LRERCRRCGAAAERRCRSVALPCRPWRGSPSRPDRRRGATRAR
jgi:hypothetical protein